MRPRQSLNAAIRLNCWFSMGRHPRRRKAENAAFLDRRDKVRPIGFRRTMSLLLLKGEPDLARGLDMSVTAEGVETPEHSTGCERSG